MPSRLNHLVTLFCQQGPTREGWARGMAEQAEKSVLRRKAGARRAAQGLAEMTPHKAMRVALAKSGDAVLKVPVALRDFKRGSLTPDDLTGALPDPALILRLDGAGGAVGLAVLCPQVVSAVIEALTMGRVTQGAAAERKATATDASLTRAFVDRVIAAFAQLSEDCRGLPAIEGYAVTGRLADARLAAMTLEDAAHLHLTAEVEMAGGAKSGVLHFVLPTRQRKQRAGEAGGGWSAALEKAVMSSPARLEAILCQFRLPLSDVSVLAPGQVVPLTRASLESVRLIATNGRKVMSARLGRSGPMRAVRLTPEGTSPRAASLPRELGGLTMPTAGAATVGGTAQPNLTDPAPMPAMADPLDDLPEPQALDDLPATLEPLPAPMDLDLPE